MIDGKLDDAAWAEASVVSGFRQKEPHYGELARLQTEVRVLYDQQFLYFGFKMRHEKGRNRVWAPIFRRDDALDQTDWTSVRLDPQLSGRSAFVFGVSASGVQYDALLHSDQQFDETWDAIWDSAVSIGEDGWTAEMRIPFSVLPVGREGQSKAWGINFWRNAPDIEESSQYLVPPRGAYSEVSRYPHLLGLEGILPAGRREWLPYVSLERKFETRQPFDDRAWRRRAGLDVRFDLSPAAHFNAAIHPDFGQVEVDQAILNLSAMETYLPEKRPFFLEGLDLFKLPGSRLFYSRRIGRALDAPVLEPGQQLLRRPLYSELFGAAKVTGQLAGGTRLTALLAMAQKAEAIFMDASGAESRRVLAPQTGFAVGRMIQPLGGSGSYVGFFGSAIKELGPEKSADVQAVDAQYVSPDRDWTGSLQVSRSSATEQGTPGKTGASVEGLVQWIPRSQWQWRANVLDQTRHFDPNDVGFLQRPDQKGWGHSIQRTWDANHARVRTAGLSVEFQTREDQAGQVFQRYVKQTGTITLAGGWSFQESVTRNSARRDDLELRTFGHPAKTYLPLQPSSATELGFFSPRNAAWCVDLLLHHEGNEGGPDREFTLKQTFMPAAQWQLHLDACRRRASGNWAYSRTEAEVPLAGLRSLDQVDMNLRITWALTTRFTLQVFSQWLDAAWSDRALTAFLPDGTRQLKGGPPSPPQSLKLWNGNVIGRWEFNPGSAVFLVYSHGVGGEMGGSSRNGISLFHDLNALRHLPSDDSIKLKVSYLFRR